MNWQSWWHGRTINEVTKVSWKNMTQWSKRRCLKSKFWRKSIWLLIMTKCGGLPQEFLAKWRKRLLKMKPGLNTQSYRNMHSYRNAKVRKTGERMKTSDNPGARFFNEWGRMSKEMVCHPKIMYQTPTVCPVHCRCWGYSNEQDRHSILKEFIF
jgi:hypothetical protein